MSTWSHNNTWMHNYGPRGSHITFNGVTNSQPNRSMIWEENIILGIRLGWKKHLMYESLKTAILYGGKVRITLHTLCVYTFYLLLWEEDKERERGSGSWKRDFCFLRIIYAKFGFVKCRWDFNKKQHSLALWNCIIAHHFYLW